MVFREMFRKMRYAITRNPNHRRPLKIWKGDGWVRKTWSGETFISVWDRVPEVYRIPCVRGSSICRHAHHWDGTILRGENLDTVYRTMGSRHGRPVYCQVGERRTPHPECQDPHCRFWQCDCYRCYPERFVGSLYEDYLPLKDIIAARKNGLLRGRNHSREVGRSPVVFDKMPIERRSPDGHEEGRSRRERHSSTFRPPSSASPPPRESTKTAPPPRRKAQAKKRQTERQVIPLKLHRHTPSSVCPGAPAYRRAQDKVPKWLSQVEEQPMQVDRKTQTSRRLTRANTRDSRTQTPSSRRRRQLSENDMWTANIRPSRGRATRRFPTVG